MGHECNRFHHHNPLHIHHRNTFLPMLCSRPSIKDVKLPNWENRSASFSDEPLSPKIGCMGQVKRNNRVIGFPASSYRLTFTGSTTTTNNSINVKYSKLKRLFSGKNLTPASATGTGANANNNGSVSVSAAARCRSRRRVVLNGANGSRNGCNSSNGENCVPRIDVVDLDPPLPVIKKVQKTEQEGEADSLWKRRSGGVALKGLQLQQIHHPKHHLQPTTV